MLWSTSISFVNHINIKYLNDSEKKVHFGIDNTWGGGIRLYASTDSAPIPERLSRLLVHCPILEAMNRFFEHSKLKKEA
jgi:hypothetical protein